MSRLKNAPEASAPGFQYTAEASSATATNAPRHAGRPGGDRVEALGARPGGMESSRPRAPT